MGKTKVDLVTREPVEPVFSGRNRVVVDLDGTLIPDEWPKIGELLPGAAEALAALVDAGYEVVVNSTRLAKKQIDETTDRREEEWLAEVAAVKGLLYEAGLPEVEVWTKPWKPGAVAYIDDKAIRFEGDWRKAISTLVEQKGEEYDAARDTLSTAAEYVAGPRSRYYGHPLDNHGRTALLWRAYILAKFGVELDLSEEDVCWMNVEQKLARDMNVPSADGVIDVAGYAANVAEVRAERDRRAA